MTPSVCFPPKLKLNAKKFSELEDGHKIKCMFYIYQDGYHDNHANAQLWITTLRVSIYPPKIFQKSEKGKEMYSYVWHEHGWPDR